MYLSHRIINLTGSQEIYAVSASATNLLCYLGQVIFKSDFQKLPFVPGVSFLGNLIWSHLVLIFWSAEHPQLEMKSKGTGSAATEPYCKSQGQGVSGWASKKWRCPKSMTTIKNVAPYFSFPACKMWIIFFCFAGLLGRLSSSMFVKHFGLLGWRCYRSVEDNFI